MHYGDFNNCLDPPKVQRNTVDCHPWLANMVLWRQRKMKMISEMLPFQIQVHCGMVFRSLRTELRSKHWTDFVLDSTQGLTKFCHEKTKWLLINIFFIQYIMDIFYTNNKIFLFLCNSPKYLSNWVWKKYIPCTQYAICTYTWNIPKYA
jgi:hypothetical protein